MKRRGQHWSIELMLALGVFVVIFVLLTALTYYNPRSTDASELVFESSSVLTSLEQDVGLLDGNKVDEVVLRELDDMSAEELAAFFNLAGDVCINFESLDGEVMVLENGELGIGYSNQSMVCGQ